MKIRSSLFCIIIICSSYVFAQEKQETVFWRKILQEKMATRSEREVIDNMLRTFDFESRHERDGRSFPQWTIDAALWFDQELNECLASQRSHLEDLHRYGIQSVNGRARFLAIGSLFTGILAFGVAVNVRNLPARGHVGMSSILSMIISTYLLCKMKGTEDHHFFTREGHTIRYAIVNTVLAYMKEHNIPMDERTKLLISKLCHQNEHTSLVLNVLNDYCVPAIENNMKE